MVDHNNVKFQSLLNSSWFIGFDRKGNPISGQDTFEHDSSYDSIEKVKCYIFRKVTSLVTKAKYFPEAMNELKLEASKNPVADSLPKDLLTLKAGSKERPYVQSQLINMTRFRNVLRFQMGRSLGQPLVAINLLNATNDNENNKTIKINAKPKINLNGRKKTKRKPVRIAGQQTNAANHTATSTTTTINTNTTADAIIVPHIPPAASSKESHLEAKVAHYSQDLQQLPSLSSPIILAPVESKQSESRDQVKLNTKSIIGENFRD